MSTSRDFKTELKEIADRFYTQLREKPAISRFATGRISRLGYVTFLQQSYHYVRATAPNLAAAAESIRRTVAPHRGEIADRFRDHAAEERGHEQWILDDLEALGEDRASVQKIQPCTAIQAYLAYSHHIARSPHAVGLFGQAYVLEGGAVQSSDFMVRGLIERSGIPNIENAVKYFQLHGEVDVDHVDSLVKALDWVTEPEDQHAVKLVAEFTSQIILDLVDYVGEVSLATV
jgi:pyrroloquinoline quinone (PQQ) biosynthesis protein C